MKMQNAEMEFVTFDAQDVIVTSGGPVTITVAGLYDGTPGNAKVTNNATGETIYDAKNGEVSDLINALNTIYGTSEIEQYTLFYVENGNGPISSLFSTSKNMGDSEWSCDANWKYNATYEWIENAFQKVQ